jgi:hypothetical protein
MGIYADFGGNIDTVFAVNYNLVEPAAQKEAASAVHHRARCGTEDGSDKRCGG